MAANKCPSCGNAAGKTAKFCKNCGFKLIADEPAPEKPDKTPPPEKPENTTDGNGIERQLDDVVSEMEAESAPTTPPERVEVPDADPDDVDDVALPGVDTDSKPHVSDNTEAAGERVSPSAPPKIDDDEEAPADDPSDSEPHDRLQPAAANGAYTLEVMNGLAAGRSVVVQGEERVTVGAKASCQLALPEDEHLSREHASFWVEDGRLMVKDEDSTNGTLLQIRDGRSLADGDLLVLGATLVKIKHTD